MNTLAPILLVDDDMTLRQRMAKAIAARGLEVVDVPDMAAAMTAAKKTRFGAAVVDMRMPGGSGLDLIRMLRLLPCPPRIVVVTGYGSIATALEAVRLGAIDYLTKPVDADRVLAALQGKMKPEVSTCDETPNPHDIPSLDRVEWEHIQRVLSDCGGNISQAARALRIDRRSLQRKLGKYPPMK